MTRRQKKLFPGKEREKGEIILYRTDDGRAEIEIRTIDDNVWLTQVVKPPFSKNRVHTNGVERGIGVSKEKPCNSSTRTRINERAFGTGGERAFLPSGLVYFSRRFGPVQLKLLLNFIVQLCLQ